MKFQAPRGVKDLLPPSSTTFRRLEDEVRQTFERAGYQEVRLPIFESTALFTRSIGESTDIVEKEMYVFSGKGGESLALRPEGTASLLRAAIEHRLAEPGRIERLFYQGPMFRHERPQAGRLRQFHQAGAELLGSADPDDDVDLISIVSQYAIDTKIPGSTLLINSMGCPACRPAYRKRLVEFLGKHKESLCETCNRRILTNPLRVLDCKVDSCQPVLEEAPHIVDDLCPVSRDHFERVLHGLETLHLPFTLSHRLVRGLDYYTETAFEWVSDALGAQSTWAAGGRYNGLVSQLGGPDVPGIGLALGLERLYLLREIANNLPEKSDPTVVLAIHPMDEQSRPVAHRLLAALRKEGTPSIGIFGQIRLKKAFTMAEKEKALFIGLIGEDEIKQGTISLKHLKTGIQKSVPVTPIDSLLVSLRKPWEE
ncbi:MAG: histidine--tRNA ligase [Nitrospirota bacterium]|nr:histidine--tRNA ligase [Nitrospirota bacterium]